MRAINGVDALETISAKSSNILLLTFPPNDHSITIESLL